MRTIKISEEVWAVIANNGKFGETADDVLGRLLNAKRNGDAEVPIQPIAWKQRRTKERMTQNDCQNNELVLRFDSGATFRQPLPPKDNIAAIRKLRNAAVEFVRKHGGTKGQEHAAIRALTSNGYHVTSKTEYQ
jgi:negative regulator of replication initiation